mgnify:CR=1 FL=1
MAKYLLSAFADEYDSDIDIQIKMLRENNIEYFEPRFINEKNISDISKSDLYELKNKLDGIKISSIASPLGKINLKDDFAEHLEKTKRTCEAANILGTKNIRAFSFYLRPNTTKKDCRNEVIDKLGQMIEIAKSAGVFLCHENEAEIYGESPDACLELLKEFDGNLKCVFDMGNFVLDGYNPVNSYNMLCEHIEYFHIKDALYKGAVVPAGRGNGCIKEILETHMKKYQKDTIITLEPHLQTFSGLNSLVGKSFDNPYKYETQQQAFLDALKCIREILN